MTDQEDFTLVAVRKPGSRRSRAELGNKVFECLTEHCPTIEEATELTGLSKAQWHQGLAYVREVLAEVHAEPVTWDARSKTYQLASLPLEVDAYISRRINSFLISLMRIYDGAFWPAGVKFETRRSADFREVDEAIKRLIQRLTWLRDDMHGDESPALARRRKAREAAGLNHS